MKTNRQIVSLLQGQSSTDLSTEPVDSEPASMAIFLSTCLSTYLPAYRLRSSHSTAITASTPGAYIQFSTLFFYIGACSQEQELGI